MDVYIFGAGASLGSQGDGSYGHHAAPLINNLFDDIYIENAKVIRVSPERIQQLKRLIGSQPLEKWLTEEWQRILAVQSREARFAGQKLFGDLALYIWWTMVGVSTTYSDTNGYHTFLRKLADVDSPTEKAFINFNYDLLLDKSLEKVYGYDLSGTLEKYTNVNYLKPHGSVNWFVDRRQGSDEIVQPLDSGHDQLDVILNKVASNMFKGTNIAKKMKVLDPFNLNLYDLWRIFDRVYSHGDYGYPLVLLPLSSKMDDLIEGFVSRMKSKFPRIFTKAKNVYVIGYSGNDALFDEMLSFCNPGTKLHIVGMTDAGIVQSKIIKTHTNLIAGSVHTNGFLDFVHVST